MSFTFAGVYSEAFVEQGTGRPLPTLAVTVYEQGTDTLATLYTDRTKATELANPLPTGVDADDPGIDSYGNCIFYAEPGLYDLGDFGPDSDERVLAPVYPDASEAGGGATGALLAALNLSDLANAGTARTNLGLGTASTAATGDFDAAGAAAAAQAASQPLDSDLTAIAALTTTAYGRAFLALADAAAARTALALGTAAVAATGDFDAAGAAAAAQAASQPLDSDLTAIAALSTTSFGRAFLALADAAAGRTALGLGTAALSASGDFQPIDSDLTSIAALSTTSYGRGLLTLANAAAADFVTKALYDANSILIATTDDTPVALTVGASTIVGRKASGNIVALTASELVTIIRNSFPVELGIAVGDETTAITTGTAKTTFRMPYAMTVTEVRASLNTASSSGIPTFDINEGAGAGTSILSTKLTIDASELTSTTAATPAVISDSALADDANITIDIDVAGTGAKGLKIWLLGTRA